VRGDILDEPIVNTDGKEDDFEDSMTLNHLALQEPEGADAAAGMQKYKKPPPKPLQLKREMR